MVKQTAHVERGTNPLLSKHWPGGAGSCRAPWGISLSTGTKSAPTLGCSIAKLRTLPAPFVKQPQHLPHSDGTSQQVGHEKTGSNRKDCCRNTGNPWAPCDRTGENGAVMETSGYLQWALRCQWCDGTDEGQPQSLVQRNWDTWEQPFCRQQQLQWGPLAEDARPAVPEEKGPVSIYI